MTNKDPERGQPSASKLSKREGPDVDRTARAARSAFREAFALHMARHSESAAGLARAIDPKQWNKHAGKIRAWRTGVCVPAPRNFPVLSFLEARCQLAPGYFKGKLVQASRTTIGRGAFGSVRERGALAWHLPDDFDLRPLPEQEEILGWVRQVLVLGSTDYRQFHNRAQKTPYAIAFSSPLLVNPEALGSPTGPRVGARIAPPELAAELDDCLSFKTAPLVPVGLGREGRWKPVTARHKARQFGILLGALAAAPEGPNAGRGVPLADLTFGLLVMPRVWSWYLQWRERRRGFFTEWEVYLLEMVAGMTKPGYGWIAQTPSLAHRLRPIPGLVTEGEIISARRDWTSACFDLRTFAFLRLRELRRLARVHHDSFEPILPVLDSDSPIGKYNLIAEEILRRAPCERVDPVGAAEAAREFLMIRLGLHLGFRQKNLRQLLICPRGAGHTPDGRLVSLQRGELRWSRTGGWEVFMPTSAFKNAHSSFFNRQPLHMPLPDVGALYAQLEAYVGRHRAVLLAGADDPKTLFVKTVRSRRTHPLFDAGGFFSAWQGIIQRYGVYNPYTGRGAIEGLLPHGPSAIRAVLATHVLKQTGSYEQASYAIQDTPEMVMKHYGRFHPSQKVAMAAEVMNRVWREL